MEEQPSAGSDVASGSLEPGSREKLFLGGLSWETNEDKVRQHFEKYGELSEVVVMRDRITGKPRGFGFVTFREKDAAERVCREPQILDGRQIDAKRSVPQEQKPRSKKIFVGGLAPDTSEDQFQEYFERYGKVTEAQIMQDHTSGRSRGFGFITFEVESSVEACFAAGSMHELGGKRVEVKTATPRGSGPMPRTPLPGVPTGMGLRAPGARPLFPGGRPAFPGFPAQMGPGGAYPMQFPSGMSGFQSASVMGAYGMGQPFAYNPYANMMMGGYAYPQYAYGPQYAGQAAAIAAAAAAQQQQQQQQQMSGYSPGMGPPMQGGRSQGVGGPQQLQQQQSGYSPPAGGPTQGPQPTRGDLSQGIQARSGSLHLQQQRLQQQGGLLARPDPQSSGGIDRTSPASGREPSGSQPIALLGPPPGGARTPSGPAPPTDPPPGRTPPRISPQQQQQQQQSPQQLRQQSTHQPLSSSLQPYSSPPQPPYPQPQQSPPQQFPQQSPQQQQFRQGQERMASYMLPPHSSPSSSRPQLRGPPP